MGTKDSLGESVVAASPQEPWWAWGLLVCLAFIPLLPHAFGSPMTMDYWFFLAKGDRLRELGLHSLGGVNPFVFTTPEGSVFLDKEWLFGLLLRGWFDLFGHQGTVALRAFWVFLLCGMFFLIARKMGASRWVTFWVFGLGAYSVLVIRMSIRPHVVGYVFLLLLFWLVLDPPKLWKLVLVVVMFMFWANIHGTFTMGGALLGTIGVWAILAPMWFRKRDPELAEHIAKWRAWWGALLLLPFVVCINPYGWRLWQVIWTFQREISSRPDVVVAPEWEAFTFQSPYALFAVGFFFLWAVTWFLPGAKKRTQWLLWAGVVALLVLSNLRFVGVAFLLLGPLVASQLSAIEKPRLRGLVSLALALLVIPLGWQSLSQGMTPSLGALKGEVPFEAMGLLEKAPKTQIRMFVNLNTTGYIAFRSHRHVKVAYDANPLTPGFWAWSQEYKKALLSPEAWESYCGRYRCNMVMLDLYYPVISPLAAHLANSSTWRLLYGSVRWALYVKRTEKLDAFAKMGYQVLRNFYDTDLILNKDKEKLLLDLKALRKQVEGAELAGWLESDLWLSKQGLSAFSARLSFSPSQKARGERYLEKLRLLSKRSPWHPGLRCTLGLLELLAGHPQKALEAFGKASKWNPNWPKPLLGLYRSAKISKKADVARYAAHSLTRLGPLGQELLLRLKIAETGAELPVAPR
ncbi:MAG: hypothetical protein H6727_08615 [Myxococcales bacterium]|nr:hypothetical protein [Myxococcales bacterium]